jgi:LuxR family maltose regulon positive regulatory protein
MPASLLSTKLYAPPTRANIIERPHLVKKLLSGVDRPGSFALLSGPAGFGKTTLLSEFVKQYKQPVAWISLDEGDNDFSQFWTYLIKASQSILDGVGQASLELLGTPQSLPDETIPTILINDFVTQPGSALLVLDDYHEIQNSSIHASLMFLLDHLPDNLYIIVSTRIDPPWPLARYRARNRLIEIRAQDLRFSVEEATEFLNRTMGLDLSAEDVASLEERTEGWIAGLQLAALSMQGREDVVAFVRAFTGSHVYVAEYLVEEVLKRLPEDIQTFLLQTSLLKRMNAGLCDIVTGCQDGQAILQELHRENIFVIPLDNEELWFRYHHLFADLLQSRLRQSLSKEEIAALQLRAADWYERNGHIVEAVHHAMAAKDFEKVVDLVRQTVRTLIFTGRVNVLRDWLGLIPESTFNAHPDLTFYRFWIDVLQNKADLSAKAIQEKEDLFKSLPSSPENDRLRGELMAVICRAIALSGRTSEGIRLAQEALAYLPTDDLAPRARANSALATAHDLEGRAEIAESLYQESLAQATAAGEYRLAAHTLMVKGLIQIHYGQLHDAAETYQTIVDMAPAGIARADSAKNVKSNKVFFPAGQGYIGLGCVYLEWNDLDVAESYLQQGMDLCRQGGLDGVFIGKVRMSRLRQARGDLTGALKEIQMSHQIPRADTFNLVTRQIQIALAEGNVIHAKRLAAPLAEMLSSDDALRPPLVFREIIEAILARVYLAQGEFEKTLRLLDELQATTEPGIRLGRLIEVHLIRALAYHLQNGKSHTSDAIESLGRALELAEPQGYVLLFLEEGPELIPLLNAVAVRRSTPERVRKYAHKLLETFDEIGKSPIPQSTIEANSLVEQLTPREVEVLGLLAIGASNQDIADKLVITVRTVKKHTGNIYGKLNVNSRIQAVTRARELGLLTTD